LLVRQQIACRSSDRDLCGPLRPVAHAATGFFAFDPSAPEKWAKGVVSLYEALDEHLKMQTRRGPNTGEIQAIATPKGTIANPHG
jgi:hypothetical protein